MKTKLMSMVLTVAMAVSPAATMIHAADYSSGYQNEPTGTYYQIFNDVPNSHWAFPYIGAMVQRGVLDGYPDGNFYPDNTVTRAEFAKIMIGAAKMPVYQPAYKYFQDVETTAWYAPYVHSAYPFLSGYDYGTNNRYYMPDEPAVREDIAVALVKLKGYEDDYADTSILSTMFTDVSSISLDARPYVAIAVERGLVSGYDDRTFRGQASITRAEAAAMLWRAYQYGNDNKVFDDDQYTAIGNNYYDDDDNYYDDDYGYTETPSVRPTSTPTPRPTKTPRPTNTPTPEPTEEPTPTPTLEPTPTPEPEKEWEVRTVDGVYIDENMSFEYMTYDLNNNLLYYYDSQANEINIYDVYNDEVIPFIDCSEINVIEDTLKTVIGTPDESKGNYYKDMTVHGIGYDSYMNRLYVTVSTHTISDIGGLSDGFIGSIGVCGVFYIELDTNDLSIFTELDYDDNMIISGSYGENLYADEGSGVTIVDRETYDELARRNFVPGSVIAVNNFVINGKWYYLKYAEGPMVYETYDYHDTEMIRYFGRASFAASNSNNFYILDSEKRLVRCDLDGNLSVLFNLSDVEIKDMKQLSFSLSDYHEMIVTDDEDVVLLPDDTRLRVIRKVR